MSSQFVDASINRWGSGLAVRLNETVVQAAGIEEGTAVRILAEPGRIVTETTAKKKSLDQMLQAFSLEQHGGELMPTSDTAGGEII
jgi:antitoxin component of MazEF toxin-antitoxin module